MKTHQKIYYRDDAGYAHFSVQSKNKVRKMFRAWEKLKLRESENLEFKLHDDAVEFIDLTKERVKKEDTEADKMRKQIKDPYRQKLWDI